MTDSSLERINGRGQLNKVAVVVCAAGGMLGAWTHVAWIVPVEMALVIANLLVLRMRP